MFGTKKSPYYHSSFGDDYSTVVITEVAVLLDNERKSRVCSILLINLEYLHNL